MTDAGSQYEIDEDPLYDKLFSSDDLANIDAVCQSYFDSSVDSECVLDTVDQCLLLEEPELCDPELHDSETCLYQITFTSTLSWRNLKILQYKHASMTH